MLILRVQMRLCTSAAIVHKKQLLHRDPVHSFGTVFFIH
jgi:hypothetical protein